MAKYYYTQRIASPKQKRLLELEHQFSEEFFNNDDYLENPEKYEHLKEEYEQLKRELDPDPFNFSDEELED